MLLKRIIGTFLFFCFVILWTSGYCLELNMKYLNGARTEVTNSRGDKMKVWKSDDREWREKGGLVSTEEMALVARAYIKHYEIFHDTESMKNAQYCLDTLLYLQADNGCFYPYLGEDGKIDKNDPNNKPDLGSHTAHTFLTLAEFCRILKDKDPSTFNRAEDSLLRVYQNIKKQVRDGKSGFGNYNKFQEMKIPAWLIEGRGDLSSIYLLGLALFCETGEYWEMGEVAKDLGQGIMEFKNINPITFPVHTPLSFSEHPGIWKTSDALHVAALVRGGKVFDRPLWISEAQDTACGFLAHLPTSYGPMNGFYPHPSIYPQTPQSAYSLIINFQALSDVTGEDDYGRIAGLCGGWFLKNNPVGRSVYQSSDGSCYRGIDERGIIEEKSLRASACGLLSFMEIYRNRAINYASYREVFSHPFYVLEAEEGKPVEGALNIQDFPYPHGDTGKVVVISRTHTFWHKFQVNQADDYFMWMSFQRQLLFSSAVAVNVRIDGGPILLVPLGGAEGEPYMIMQRVIDPVRLLPGLHTVGVRYRGLLLTKPAVVDCVVLQPVLQRRIFVNDSGKKILLVKNWINERKSFEFPEEIKTSYTVSVRGREGKPFANPVKEEKGARYFVIPGGGIGIMEW